jgi:hypothetical protein
LDAVIAAECVSGYQDVKESKRVIRIKTESLLSRARELFAVCENAQEDRTGNFWPCTDLLDAGGETNQAQKYFSKDTHELEDALGSAFNTGGKPKKPTWTVGSQVLYKSKYHRYPLAAEILSTESSQEYFTILVYETSQTIDTVRSMLA